MLTQVTFCVSAVVLKIFTRATAYITKSLIKTLGNFHGKLFFTLRNVLFFQSKESYIRMSLSSVSSSMRHQWVFWMLTGQMTVFVWRNGRNFLCSLSLSLSVLLGHSNWSPTSLSPCHFLSTYCWVRWRLLSLSKSTIRSLSRPLSTASSCDGGKCSFTPKLFGLYIICAEEGKDPI